MDDSTVLSGPSRADTGYTNKSKSNMQFHSLQKVDRSVGNSSINIGRINRDGLHKLDINMVQNQEKINEYYQDNAKSVHKLAVRPSVGEWNTKAEGASMFVHPRNLGRWVQNTKGLSNFSSVTFGDNRIQRVNSAYREEYRNPVDREMYGKPLMDPSFRNVQSRGHGGCGTYNKTFVMSDELQGDDASSIGLGSTNQLEQVQQDSSIGQSIRISLYRNAIELVGALDLKSDTSKPEVLYNMEKMFRWKLGLKVGKGITQFQLPSMFAYLDRSGRGGFDLEDFRVVLDAMVMNFNEFQTIALFAKYDIGFKGYVSYHDFYSQLGFDPQLNPIEADRLLTEHAASMQRNVHMHQGWSADFSRNESRLLKQVLAKEDLTSNDSGEIYNLNQRFDYWIAEVRRSSDQKLPRSPIRRM